MSVFILPKRIVEDWKNQTKNGTGKNQLALEIDNNTCLDVEDENGFLITIIIVFMAEQSNMEHVSLIVSILMYIFKFLDFSIEPHVGHYNILCN